MDNWMKLNDKEYDEIWTKVYETFSFKPSIYKRNWPSFKEPSPFITFDISDNYDDNILDEWYEIASKVIKECTDVEEYIYALDWQHESYLYNPHIERPGDRRNIEPFPDGDYYLFLPKDISWGILTHPWEETICIFGKDMLDRFLKYNPRMLRKKKRQG
jgi:hypothetical protein